VILHSYQRPQSAPYFDQAKILRNISSFPDIVAILDALDDYLAFRTFLVGRVISAADWILWGSLKGSHPLSLTRTNLICR
jgi:glutamyl-tRNA synthetase